MRKGEGEGKEGGEIDSKRGEQSGKEERSEKVRGRERGREGAEPWQGTVVEKMPCFVERILPGQEGEVRQSAEGGLLPGKTLSVSITHTHTSTCTHTHTHTHTSSSSSPSHKHTHSQVECYVANGFATICSWHESGAHV